MSRFYRVLKTRKQRGQTILMLVVCMFVLLLFVGLAIDIGFGYVTEANLSKAVDAAALTGITNLSLGQAQAQSLAQNSFNINYGTSVRDVSPPTVAMSFNTDANNNTFFNVSAKANINTFFLGILPQYHHLAIGATAQSIRAPLVMSLVLDRSGSMAGNGGGVALQAAVPDFVDKFDNDVDQVAGISFASDATVDFQLSTVFQSSIKTVVSRFKFNGGTFGPGGMVDALAQENSKNAVAGAQKVVVYFTDGWANIVQQSLNCGGNATTLNFGGYDGNVKNVDFFAPATGNTNCSLTNGGTPSCCSGVSRFQSLADNKLETFVRANVTNEALYEAVQTANTMRNQNITVYAIGLGTDINQGFLQQIANDPKSPTYDSTKPQGLALFVPDCPSAACTSDLNTAFQTIASTILLRLTK